MLVFGDKFNTKAVFCGMGGLHMVFSPGSVCNRTSRAFWPLLRVQWPSHHSRYTPCGVLRAGESWSGLPWAIPTVGGMQAYLGIRHVLQHICHADHNGGARQLEPFDILAMGCHAPSAQLFH